MAVGVDDDDPLRPGRDGGVDPRRVEIPRVALRIDQHWRGAGVADGVRGGDHRECGQHDLVPRAQPKARQGEVQRRSPVRACHAVPASDQLGEGVLKLPDETAGRGDPVRLDALGEILELVAVQARVRDRDDLTRQRLFHDGDPGEADLQGRLGPRHDAQQLGHDVVRQAGLFDHGRSSPARLSRRSRQMVWAYRSPSAANRRRLGLVLDVPARRSVHA